MGKLGADLKDQPGYNLVCMLKKKLRPDFLWIIFGRLATALISIVSLRIITTLFEPSVYGQLALLGAFQTFCGLFLINPIIQHINRQAHSWWDEGTLLLYLAKYDGYIRLVSLFILVVVTFWWHYQYANNTNGLILSFAAGSAVAAMVYVGTWNAQLVWMLTMLGFRNQSVIWMVTSALIGLACSSYLVMDYSYAFSWLFGQAIGMTVGALGSVYTLRRHITKNTASQISIKSLDKNTLLTFCLPLAVATGFMWLQNTGYRFWVDSVWGAAELGVLAIGLGVSAQLWSIMESLAVQILYPYFYRHISDTQSDSQSGAALSDLLAVLIPVYAVFAGLNAVCATALLQVLTDERYHIAAPFVILGAIVEFARCVTNLWSNAAQAKRKTKGVILPYGLGALVVWGGAVGSLYFSKHPISLALVLVMGGLLTCFSMIVLMKRLLVLSVDKVRLFIGLIIMLVCFAWAFKMPIQVSGLTQNLVLLGVSGSLAACFMLALLWRNPALSRLLSTSLRTNYP